MIKWQAKGKKLKNVLELDESFENYIKNSVPDPWQFAMDPDPVWIWGSVLLMNLDLAPALGSALFVSDLQNANRK